MKRVCVFCGSNQGAKDVFSQIALELGALIASRSMQLVYGGGNVGLMGMLADSVLAHGGEVSGVIPQALVEKELAHEGLTHLHVVHSMHERKALMAQLSEGFIAMPGGYGTLEEFCEILTWSQLGIHNKPCGLLNIDHYYDFFLAQLDHSTAMNFIRHEHRNMVLSSESPADLLDLMEHCKVTTVEKWISRDET